VSHSSHMDHHLLIRCQRRPVSRPKKRSNNVNVGGLHVDWTPAQTPAPPSRVGRGLHPAAPPSQMPVPRASGPANSDDSEEDNGVKAGGISDSDQFAGRPQGNAKPVRYYGGGFGVKKAAVSKYPVFHPLYLHMLGTLSRQDQHRPDHAQRGY
jgi:hypothetical protein